MYVAKATSRINIRELTNTIRKLLGLYEERYFPIIEFLEFGLGYIFPDFSYEIVSPLDMKSDYGVTYPQTNKIKLREDVYENAIAGSPRDRFTVAHEIGHLIMHRPGSIALARSQNAEIIPTYKDPEWQANTFAAELLAPPHLIVGLSIKEIAISCGVSLEVARIQAQFT
ncbi:ImmA/IrrE family metallo-endopeptidase [Geobacillus subterraneus]|uniref:ImmA/IrrE family metallo-endopeptidase n=1 Tax=Geobacillus subterraneus TaxID=129338 RepID=UPI0017CE143F